MNRERATRTGWDRALLVAAMLFAGASVVVLALGLVAVVASRTAGISGTDTFHGQLHVIGLGTGLFARAAEGVADAAHHVEPAGPLTVDYLFSGFNLLLAIFLLWLQPTDRTARLLALGMIGTAALFNLQAVGVYEQLPKTGLERTIFSLHRLVAAASYVAALLLFPDGRLIPRWPRWALASLYGSALLIVAYLSFLNQDIEGTAETVRLVIFFGILTPSAALLSQAYRFRHARSVEERRQSGLVFWALMPSLVVGLFVLTQGIDLLLSPGLEGRPVHDLPPVVFRVFQWVFALVPIALFVGLFRFRLWSIDRVISRTLLYGALVVFISAGYVGLAVGLGRIVGAKDNNLVLSIGATAIVAVAFQPAKERLQRLANRAVYGKRATPYEVVSELSERMSESCATEELLTRVARALGEATASQRAEVWLRVGSELRLASSWPGDDIPPSSRAIVDESLPQLDASQTVAVRHQGELLGALAVVRHPGESLRPLEERLMSDLASQAGLVLRNVRLTAELLDSLQELRASRQRLVAVQDEGRRRLERDLHDGAQQQLLALKLKIALAERLTERAEPGSQSAAFDVVEHLRPLLSELRNDSDNALETLRDLARGIYPPLLAAEGLPAALRAHGRKGPLVVDVESTELGRMPGQVEASVYFCCLEALQNVIKHAEASRVRVELGCRDGLFLFSISDDGKGFEPSCVVRGSGLRSMADRIEALGGRLDVDASLGAGTIIRGQILLSQVGEQQAVYPPLHGDPDRPGG